MAKQKMFKFNVKTLKYSIFSASAWGSPVDLAYAESISLEPDFAEQKLYGDGEIQGILANDKGRTGTIGVTNIEEVYEIAMKRMLAIVGGTADLQQREVVEHCIYYEIEAHDDGDIVTIKNWLYGCITGKPTEAHEQTKDDVTINTYDYPLTVLGINLRNNGDTADYTDANGNNVKVYRLTAYPGDTGYATFGDAVVIPKVVA